MGELVFGLICSAYLRKFENFRKKSVKSSGQHQVGEVVAIGEVVVVVVVVVAVLVIVIVLVAVAVVMAPPLLSKCRQYIAVSRRIIAKQLRCDCGP